MIIDRYSDVMLLDEERECMDNILFVFLSRYDSHSGGEREIQRTMLELLNQLDGFDSRGDVKVCTYVRMYTCVVSFFPSLE